VEVFADSLPGIPDNIVYDKLTDLYFVGFSSRLQAGKFSLFEFAVNKLWLRSVSFLDISPILSSRVSWHRISRSYVFISRFFVRKLIAALVPQATILNLVPSYGIIVALDRQGSLALPRPSNYIDIYHFCGQVRCIIRRTTFLESSEN